MKPIYLDYNATTPLLPEVVEAMKPFLAEHFGNPSSSHWYGRLTRTAVERARKAVAAFINCDIDEVVFTSGGSESNNYAIKGAAYSRRSRGQHIITSQIEHPAVSEVCDFLSGEGFTITRLPVSDTGIVDPEDVRKAIRDETILITIMHANNEVGTIQPIAEIAAAAREHGVPMHSDAAQSAGKIPIDVMMLGVDMLSLAGHKLYAPKGIGALYIRRGLSLEKQIHGADHENNRRAGTENVLEIVGLGKACELALENMEKDRQHLKAMRDRLERGLMEQLPDIRINGDKERRLPNTLSISIKNVEANTILDELADHLAASAGAACHSDQVDLSPTLEAMHVPLDYAMGTIRLSVGKPTVPEEIDRAVEILSGVVGRLADAGAGPADIKSGPDIRLTRFTHGLGCACKLRPQALERILHDFPAPGDPNILVGFDQADDAAVYRLDEQTALVQTVDFFTPVVDDPYDFGRIAAANALSDIYAMGAEPLFALNIVGFPSNRLDMSVLQTILKGAHEVAGKAGIHVLGGHTIDDPEPKYGMVVCGRVHPDKILTNSGARAGDRLILTKPVGTGILTTALKRGLLDPSQVRAVTDTMAELNRKAAEIAAEFKINACTDVTGFGLLGHLREMSKASGLNAVVHATEVPVLGTAFEMAVGGIVPGGTENNLAWLDDWIDWDDRIPNAMRLILCDAQTSGGLLLSLPEDEAGNLVRKLHDSAIPAARIIGYFSSPGPGNIEVVPDEEG